jgi:hypothetical protein
MISAPTRCATATLRAVFPEAVGPTMARVGGSEGTRFVILRGETPVDENQPAVRLPGVVPRRSYSAGNGARSE